MYKYISNIINIRDSPVLGHLALNLGISLSTQRFLPSLIQPMRVYHCSPPPATTFVGHPPPPHFPSHSCTVDAHIRYPPPPIFPSDASAKAATIDASSDQVVHPSAPLATDSPPFPKLFTMTLFVDEFLCIMNEIDFCAFLFKFHALILVTVVGWHH